LNNVEQDGARILAIVGPQIARFAVPPPRKHDIEPDDGVVVAYRPWGRKAVRAVGARRRHEIQPLNVAVCAHRA